MSLDLKVLVAEGGVENFVLYKLLSTQCPKYLFDIVPYSESFYDTRKKQTFFRLRNWLFQIFFLSKFTI